MITNIIEAIDLYITLLEDKGAPYSKNPFWKKPLHLYHGTNKEFDKFDLSKSGSSNDHGMYGKGIYLTNNKNVAKAFGGKRGHIKQVETTFKNPLYIKNRKHEKQVMRDFNKSNDIKATNGSEKYPKPTKEFSDKFREYLINKGYDGYISSISKGPHKERQYVALNPCQAKITGKISEGEVMSISEACHKDIIDLVEEYINEAIPSIVDKPGKNIGSKAFRQDWARVMKAREGSDLKVTSTKPKPAELQTAKSTLRNVKKSIKKEGVTPEKQQKAKELASQITELTKKRKRESGSPFTVMYTTEDFNTLCEALLGLAKPKKQEVSPKMLELRDKILKANKVEEQPKQHKRKIEVPKVTVQGVFGEAVELAEVMIHEVSKELAGLVLRKRINDKDSNC